MKWSVVYEKAIQDDGTLFFPERLSKEFLDSARRTMGSYLFANQYQNEVIPRDDQTFKPEWIRYWKQLPQTAYRFAFCDPAISQDKGADYTAMVVIEVDSNKNWYVLAANRYKITPSQLIDKIFEINDHFKVTMFGIEDVAYQKALLYLMDEEMRRRGRIVPLKGVRPDASKSKELRILGLVPRFEWSRIWLAQGLNDLETELMQFPRGTHDDLLDSLAYCDQIAMYPEPLRGDPNAKPSHHSIDYEKWFIRSITNRTQDSDD